MRNMLIVFLMMFGFTGITYAADSKNPFESPAIDTLVSDSLAWGYGGYHKPKRKCGYGKAYGCKHKRKCYGKGHGHGYGKGYGCKKRKHGYKKAYKKGYKTGYYDAKKSYHYGH